jgi:hypothetical protein
MPSTFTFFTRSFHRVLLRGLGPNSKKIVAPASGFLRCCPRAHGPSVPAWDVASAQLSAFALWTLFTLLALWNLGPGSFGPSTNIRQNSLRQLASIPLLELSSPVSRTSPGAYCGVIIPPIACRRGSTMPRWSTSVADPPSLFRAAGTSRSISAPPHAGHQSAFVASASTA